MGGGAIIGVDAYSDCSSGASGISRMIGNEIKNNAIQRPGVLGAKPITDYPRCIGPLRPCSRDYRPQFPIHNRLTNPNSNLHEGPGLSRKHRKNRQTTAHKSDTPHSSPSTGSFVHTATY